MKPPGRRPRAPKPAAAVPIATPARADFVLSWVDEPRPGTILQQGSLLTGKGWAVSEAEIASIAVHLGEHFLCYADYGRPRPEVGRDFSHYPQAHHSGFTFQARLGPELLRHRGADLVFRIRTGSGAEASRVVKLAWPAQGEAGESPDQAARPWPIRLALEECRVDAAGRLHLRGWAIARLPVTSLDLYLGGMRLDPPEHGLARPEIATRFPEYPNAGQSGFRLIQHLASPPDPAETIRAIARAGALQRQIIVPLATPDAGRTLLRDGAVTLCCETLNLAPDSMLTVAGWAVGPAETREIEILAAGTSLGLARTGLPRPDIGNRFPALPGARHAGFRFLHPSLPDGIDRLELVVRDSAGAERRLLLQLPGRRPAEAPATEPDIVHLGIDHPAPGRPSQITGVVGIVGWAVAPSGVAKVEIWQDDILLGQAYRGIKREDIAAQHPELPAALTAGFALNLPHRRLGAGEHTLRAVATAASGASAEHGFRVLLSADDDRGAGSIRRSIPYTETRLRREILAGHGLLPGFTIVIREPNAEGLRGLPATLETLRRQTLQDWQAILLLRGDRLLAAATQMIASDPALAGRVIPLAPGTELPLFATPTGRYELFCLLRAGDRLGADALMELAVETRLSGAEFVYADERCHDRARDSQRPFPKPGWSPDLLLSMNYIGRAWCATAALAQRTRLTLARIRRLGEYDTILRLTEQAAGISHLPISLCERAGRQLEPSALEQAALVRAADRRAIVASVLPGRAPGSWRLQRAVHTQGLVSIIIPSCGARGLLRQCIASLRANTDWPVLEIIVLDDIPATDPELKSWLATAADQVIAIDFPFNWSRANNLGAARARGEFLLFLNDDTECRDPGWLRAMLEHAQRPEIAVVGPQLLYPDGKVQHAGMFLRGGDGMHAFRFADADDPGAFGLALTQRDVTAVTGAAMLMRRTVFETLGRFDESHGVIKNDLDFCLRAGAAGLGVVYTPYASLTHHEMASRSHLPDSYDRKVFDSAWAIAQLQGDRLHNQNLAADSEDVLAEIEPVQYLQPGAPVLDAAGIARILVVKLDHIGDFITAVPAIGRLRAAFPAARITLLAAEASLSLVRLIPGIDEVLQFDFFASISAQGRRAVSETELEALAAELRPRQFDLAIDLRPFPDTRHILRYSGAGRLAGFDHGGRFGWLDIAVEWEGDLRLLDKRAHIADTLLRLVDAVAAAAALPPVLVAPLLPAGLLSGLLGGAPQGFAGPLVCIHPGAGTALKQWPPAAYAGLIALLLHHHRVGIVLIGTGVEVAIAADIAAIARRPDAVFSLAGTLPLEDLPALLGAACLFIGNDSGPKHLAAALGTPTIGIHASHVDAAEWGPQGPRAIAIRRHMSCGPCYIADEADCPRALACLRGITPAQVYRAARLLLGLPGGAAAVA